MQFRVTQAYRNDTLLQTLPGLDALSTVMLLVEIGIDMERFGSKERLSSWAGLCPGNHESAGKKVRSCPPRQSLCQAALVRSG